MQDHIHKDFVSDMQHDIHTSLPQPDALSASHCQRVEKFIRDRIDEAGGSISFAEFMHHSLYAPGLGYYAAGASKFGEAGDFVTAPEVSAIFGRVLARQCAEVLGQIPRGSILEYGAGSGKLAGDILSALETLDALPERYEILEVSGDLKERQEAHLCAEVPHLFSRVSWVQAVPEQHRGVIIANEVLDALPVERFRKSKDGFEQLRVTLRDGAFAITGAPAPRLLAERVEAIEGGLGEALPVGYVSEVSLGVHEWIVTLGESLQEGIALLFDYGVTQREYYARERSDGWLRCHFRHHVHDNPLILTGIQDLTAWVDFSAVAEAALAGGFEIAGYSAQAQFLIGGGLDLEMQEFAALPLKRQLQLSGQIKTLTLPAEMGEHFKCMALRRGAVRTPSAFSLADRTHTL
ncbi:MAG: SAM-dependent methyltransferase [Woeseiaceae bacterium]